MFSLKFRKTRGLLGQLRAITTSSGSECILEKLSNGISVITLNRPRQRNALGTLLLDEFKQHLNLLRHDKGTRVVVLRSSVDGVFCAGADLKERALMNESQVAEFVHNLRASFNEFGELLMPTIACIDGFALGGGFELALGADMRIAGESAKFGLPETGLAIIPGAGGTQRLPRLVGVAKAKELIFTGAILNSKQAFEQGLVNQSVTGSSFPVAMKIAEVLLSKGPVALKMAKLAINHGSQLDLSNALAFEKTCYAQVIPTEDRIEGLTAFKEKRSPVYKGK